MITRYAQAMPEDCTRCAACCFSESERYARVTGDDYARLGDAAADLVIFVENQAFMRMDRSAGVGHCAALAPDGSGGFACTVYDRRPTICRTLERGSPECEGERVTKGGRPRRLLTILGRRPFTPPA